VDYTPGNGHRTRPFGDGPVAPNLVDAASRAYTSHRTMSPSPPHHLPRQPDRKAVAHPADELAPAAHAEPQAVPRRLDEDARPPAGVMCARTCRSIRSGSGTCSRTYLTSAVVSGSILGVILIGTLWMELRSIPWYVASASLIVTLLASWLVPTYLLLSRDGPVRLAPSAAYVGAPIFFDAACFGLRFQQRRRVDIMFGWNLIGAVARGGVGEFLSMAVGLRALTLVVLAAYAGAAGHRQDAVTVEAEAKRPEPVPAVA